MSKTLEHCLSALSRAQAHIEKYPSKAEDAGTKKQTIQHLMQRVLNTMYCHREVSDTQVALALLNGLGAEATSDSFSYYGAAYMNNFIDGELTQNCGPMECNNVQMVEDVESTEEEQDAGEVDPLEDLMNSITNFGGAVPSLTTKELGPAPFYRTLQPIDGELKSQSVPVHYQMHWRYRGEGLAMMTPAEYYATTRVVPLPRNMESLSGNEDNCNSEDFCGLDCESEGGLLEASGQNTKCGRVSNKRFRFAKEHPLYRTHCQCLRSKQVTLIHNGFAPEHPGPKPECPETNVEVYEQHYRVWKLKADAFAKYYLCTFRPMEEVYSGDHKISNPQEFTWEALCSWVEAMEGSSRLVDRLRVRAMFNHIYGFRSKSKHSEVLNAYRMRKRTVWSEEQKVENREVYSGFRTYRQDLRESNEEDFGGSTCHVFRTQDVTEMSQEVHYCSEQMKSLNHIFKKLDAKASSAATSGDYEPAKHAVLDSSSPEAMGKNSNALRSAKPKKADEDDKQNMAR